MTPLEKMVFEHFKSLGKERVYLKILESGIPVQQHIAVARQPQNTTKYYISQEREDERRETCQKCIYWQKCSVCGIGETMACKHPKVEYGITDARLKLKGLRCPIRLWREDEDASETNDKEEESVKAKWSPDKKVSWSYGILTVPERRYLFKETFKSLTLAGFESPIIFVDSGNNVDCGWYRDYSYRISISSMPPLQVVKRSWLALLELYVSAPDADRYALFQDDVLAYRNLKEYLGGYHLGDDVYWNLFTAPQNESIPTTSVGWYSAPRYPNNENMPGGCGKGAQGLVFSNKVVRKIIASDHLVEKVRTPEGWRNFDGAVVALLGKQGIYEQLHNPSLLQHIGVETTVPLLGKKFIKSRKWRGEDFDALTLLQEEVLHANSQ